MLRDVGSAEVERVDPRAGQVVREEPCRVSAVGTEFEHALALEQLGERGDNERSVLRDGSFHHGRVDTADAREIDVAHARCPEALEVRPNVLQQSATHSAWLRECVSYDSPNDIRKDVPVADVFDALRSDGRELQRRHAAPSARSTAGTVRTKIRRSSSSDASSA